MSKKVVLVALDSACSAAVAPVAAALAELENATSQVFDLAGTRGSPAEEMTRAAREGGCSLIVTVMGPLAEEILQRASCPLVLVGPRPHVPYVLRTILLPHDGTPSTAATFASSATLARRAGARVEVLHVCGSGIARPTELGSMTTPCYVDQAQHEWPSWTHEFMNRLGCLADMDPASMHFETRAGDPAREILGVASAHGCDLIVLPWRGALDPLRARILKEVLRGAPCPVMVVRTPQD